MQTLTHFGQNKGGYWAFTNAVITDQGKLLTANKDRIFIDREKDQHLQLANHLQEGPRIGRPTMPMGGIPTAEDCAAYARKADAPLLHFCMEADRCGDLMGLLAVGQMLSYPAHGNLIPHAPGLWLHGVMTSGKTTFAGWLCRIWGHPAYNAAVKAKYNPENLSVPTDELSQVPLSNLDALIRHLERFSNLPAWIDDMPHSSLREPSAMALFNLLYETRPFPFNNSKHVHSPTTAPVICCHLNHHTPLIRGRFINCRTGYQPSYDGKRLNHMINHIRDELPRIGFAILIQREKFLGLMLLYLTEISTKAGITSAMWNSTCDYPTRRALNACAAYAALTAAGDLLNVSPIQDLERRVLNYLTKLPPE